MNSLRSLIAPYYRNLRGWRTKRKIVVFESDDWGSINMPDPGVYNDFLKAGYPVDQNKYEKYDSLESNNDLELLFGLLSGFIDKNGNHPIITANCLVANPDFEAIRKNNFQEYSYELVTETFKKYPGKENGFQLWKQGHSAKVFKIQFHGREHLNIKLFIDALQKGDRDAHFSFERGKPGCVSRDGQYIGNIYVEATRFRTEKEKHDVAAILNDGLGIFRNLMGYASESIIPTNYLWSPDFDEITYKHGVKYNQGYRIIAEPGINGSSRIIHSHYLGKKNRYGQLYLIRNASFEPAFNESAVVENCLYEIAAAFRLMKPAVISTHRINFAGSLVPDNRDRSLKQLNKLISLLLKRWPDVEFMASDALGEIIGQAN